MNEADACPGSPGAGGDLEHFEDLNARRRPGYYKDPRDESFLDRLNEALAPLESDLVEEAAGEAGQLAHPLVFVYGAPRSGTTLLSQVLAHGLDAGYVTNLGARFFRNPVAGIKLSKAVFGTARPLHFTSRYATTDDPADIHEYGYFWREWLKKHNFKDVRAYREMEDSIDWPGLRRVMKAMQAQFDRPMVFKNILGSYHLARFRREMGPVIGVYVERERLDAAVSILDARRRYYHDIGQWWSYVPPEHEDLLEADAHTQIAGQVHRLVRFYRAQAATDEVAGMVVGVRYEDLCRNPHGVLADVCERASGAYGVTIGRRDGVPEAFPLRGYHDDARRRAERERFAELFAAFDRREPLPPFPTAA